MSNSVRYWGLGQRVAPPRFVLFVLVFAIGLVALIPRLGLGRGTMAAFVFNIGVLAFTINVLGSS